ncbi:MAG TPA: divalent-cation tolerance protein CutA [Terriglobales bacterium]|jgi:periplasmic divalent cation tolerance protein
MTDKRIVLTTAGSQEEAQKIAQALVERRLAACVNIVSPVESVYRWRGKIETAREWLMLIKTTEKAFAQIRDSLRELHSYEVPECVLLSIEDGSTEYLSWIGDQVGPQ